MNSRGKPLTPFETFKARYEQYLIENCADIQLPALQTSQHNTIAAYFSHQIDTTWADLFWPFRDKAKATFDTQLMHFMAAVAINHKAAQRIPLPLGHMRKIIDSQATLSLDYFIGRGSTYGEDLIVLLDVLSAKRTFSVRLPSDHPFKEQQNFEAIINNRLDDAGYHERILFYGYTGFLVQWNGDNTGLSDWMRVVYNLSEHTRAYNSDMEYVSAIRALRRLLPQSNIILEHLTTTERIGGFNEAQIKEERIKAGLILRSSTWADTIYELERHPYFKGQLSFALAFSGIETYFMQYGNCDWVAIADEAYLNRFKSYAEKTFTLFNGGGLVPEAVNEHRLHRAVLAKGDYLLYAKQNFSFLRSFELDVSWKRLLLGDDARAAKRKYFKKVLDDARYNPADLSTLEVIATDIPADAEHWRSTFLENPGVFAYMGEYKWFRMPDADTTEDKVYLLRGMRMNGAHAELFTYALYLNLKANLIFAPFRWLQYEEQNLERIEPYFRLFGFTYKQKPVTIRAHYAGNGTIRLRVIGIGAGDEYATILVQFGFAQQGNDYLLIAPEAEVSVLLQSVCNVLNRPANL